MSNLNAKNNLKLSVYFHLASIFILNSKIKFKKNEFKKDHTVNLGGLIAG